MELSNEQNCYERSYRLTLAPMNFHFKSHEGQTILDALAGAGVAVHVDCGGRGRCGKCIVNAYPPTNLFPPTGSEIQILKDTIKFPDRIERLACQAKIKGDVVVSLSSSNSFNMVLPKSYCSTKFSANPCVKRININGPQSSDPAQDFNSSIADKISAACGRPIFSNDLKALRELSTPLAQKCGVTVVLHDLFGLTAVLSGAHQKSTGIAIDIGTTSIAAYLCDFYTGDILASEGMLNPQQCYGADVMSRIDFACRDHSGLFKLNKLVVQGVNDLILKCIEKSGIDRKDIDEMTIVGNTTMQQIFAGFHPHNLSKAPFKPFRRFSLNSRAENFGCDLNQGTNVFVFPVVSGFIGGDTLGCILYDNTHIREEVTLLIDIGTNGELVLGNKTALWATSCATGPALEGACISCGMRASTGAIHSVSINPENFDIGYHFFGEGKGTLPIGLCGTGLIDAVAEMLRAGIVLPNGAISTDLPTSIYSENGNTRSIVIVPKTKSATGREIFLNAKDIRQVQLAKAALSAGITVLKQRSGFTRIDRVVVTGAFGASFNLENACTVGILPKEIGLDRIQIVPNAAGLGAILTLLNKEHRKEVESFYSEIKSIELATDPNFSSVFIEMMHF